MAVNRQQSPSPGPSDDGSDVIVIPPGRTTPSAPENIGKTEKDHRYRQFRGLLGELKALADDFESTGDPEKDPEESPCTDDNWKRFLPYMKVYKERGIAPAPYPIDDPKSWKAIRLVYNAGRTEIEIWSERLQSIFLDTIDVSAYSAVTVYSAYIMVGPPWVVMYHELDRLKEAVDADEEVPEDDRRAFQALYYYVTLDLPKNHFQNVKRLMKHGAILYGDIWALFSVRSMVVCKDHLDNWVISKVLAVKFEEDNRYSGYERFRWFVTTSSLVRAGGKYHESIQKRRLETFDGVKRILDLDFYPLEYLQDHEEVKAAAIERGKRWKQYCESEPGVMSYEGQSLAMLQVTNIIRVESYPRLDSARSFNPSYVSYMHLPRAANPLTSPPSSLPASLWTRKPSLS
jgi:hypothetical protein